jgi:ribosomal protein L11 methylase PrmA
VQETEILSSSFRDPSGAVFCKENQIYRQINLTYQSQFEHLVSSGLYDALIQKNLLIAHDEIAENNFSVDENCYKIIKPEQIPYISYPYEWSYSQLKDAALCTMQIQELAVAHGMVLKDASAYNIQFLNGRSVFIDTLSFEFYEEGKPWIAYKQFCQHFIGPLSLMAYTDERLSQLFRIYMDGPPLDMVSTLLPAKTWFKYSLLTHVHLHARTQRHYANVAGESERDVVARPISKLAFQALMSSIENCVKGLHWKMSETEWGDYYAATNYQSEAMQHKEILVAEFLQRIPEKTTLLHDLGANDGHFSRIAAAQGYIVMAQDIDPVAVEKNYLFEKKQNEHNILPLIQDLTNPSGGIGWALTERDSFIERCKDSTILALALIHHLALSNNVPLEKLADFFSSLAKYLIIEFVPKEDSQVKRLLTTREDIFPHYHIQGFEQAFSGYFKIVSKEDIRDSHRTLYLLEKTE